MPNKIVHIILVSLLHNLLFPVLPTHAVDTNLSVSATVPAQASDFETSISSVATASEPYPQNTEITYTITYGSTLNTLSSYTLQAQWYTGSISGGGSADVVDYVIGSASTGYGGATPVIDTVNKTISWDIVDSPANTVSHTVSFTLKTNSNYTSSNVVTFTTASRIIGPGVQTDDETKNLTYRYESTITPTVTPAPTNTSSPGTNPSATPSAPTISPTPSIPPSVKLLLNKIDITQLTATNAEIIFTTNQPTTAEFFLGTNKDNLTSYEKMLDKNYTKKILLSDLTPETKYYFQIVSTNDNGKKITSDIFTFETAKEGQELIINTKNSFITWNQLIIASFNSLLIHAPTGKPITINLPIDNPEQVASIIARFENKQVLGITDDKPLAPEYETSLIQSVPGIFSGEIRTPSNKGQYQIIFSIREISGSFYDVTLPYSIYVGQPLKFVDKNSKEPIENIQVKVNKIDKSFSIPISTDENGELNIILPSGKYTIKAELPGYSTEKFTFSLNIKSPYYPTLELTKSSFYDNKISYFIGAFGDVFSFLERSIDSIVSSSRAREVVFLILFILTALHSIFILKRHVSALSTKKKSFKINSYSRWVLECLIIFISYLLLFVNLVCAILVICSVGIITGLPFVLPMLLSITAWHLNTKDTYTYLV